MFELQPPGSFPLCVDQQFQLAAAGDLQQVSLHVREATRPFPVVGLILTGSVARGEGTVIADEQHGTRWLGDLECLLMLAPAKPSCIQRINDTVRKVETRLNDDSRNRSRGLKIGVSCMSASRLAHLRRSIFNRELLEHGKLLWGNPDGLPMPSWWTIGFHDVPVSDALRLLNNRIIQQVAARAAHERAEMDPLAAEYAINKFWIELATSLSVFLGAYRTTYRDRQHSIETLLLSRRDIFGAEMTELLINRLREAMEVKFGHRPTLQGSALERFDEVARAASRIWYWETARMAGVEPEDTDWRLVIDRLRRLETAGQRLRDWMRFLVRDRSIRHLGAEAFRNIRAGLRAGSRANAVYATGCLLEFFWNEIGSEKAPGPQITDTLAGFFAVRSGSGKMLRAMLTREAQVAWEQHLRFAPV